MHIKIIITGGTIDKEYNELDGTLRFSRSRVKDMVAQGRVTADVSYEEVFLMDSLDMTDADRDRIADACARASELHIVITHGTDTMVETAAVLAKRDLKKTIVLTGAMIPYSITNSDALFNIGSAVSAAQLATPGVYIAMNGRIFNWDKVRKDKERGVFVETR